MTSAYFILSWLLLALQRLSELWIAKRHEAWLRSRGAVEHGAAHYPWVVALMLLFFAALPLEFFGLHPRPPAYWPLLLALLGLTQALRAWSMLSLGKRWTTRIWILPGAPLVARGPYRYLRHPNYWAVLLELLLIPWLFGCYRTMLLFTLLYLAWLRVRLRAENAALRGTL